MVHREIFSDSLAPSALPSSATPSRTISVTHAMRLYEASKYFTQTRYFILDCYNYI